MSQLETILKGKTMKTYQAFAQMTRSGQLINTEIQAYSKEEAEDWFDFYTFKHETVYLKEVQ